MPSRVKLLNVAAAGATGTTFKIGIGQPPYSIRVIGGFTNGTGAVGTNGVNIETSPDNGTNFNRAIGIVGGENETETQTGEMVDLHDKANCVIQYYCKHIRAKTGSGMIGTATVYVEMGR